MATRQRCIRTRLLALKTFGTLSLLPVVTIDARDPQETLKRICYLFHGVLPYSEATIDRGECLLRNRE